MTRAIVFSLPVVSALLTTLSFPSVDLGFLAWVGLSPLLIALRLSRPAAAAGLGFLFGCLFCIGTFYWLNGIAGVTLPVFLLPVAAFGVYSLLFGFLYNVFGRSIGPSIILGAPALWVALEYTRVNLFFLSLPWNLLGQSQYHYLPVIQIADLTGVYGVSFVLVMVNQLVSEILELAAFRRTPRPNWVGQILAVTLVLGLTLTYGWSKLIAPVSGGQLRVAIVQANVLARNNMTPPDRVAHLRAYERLTREAASAQPDLIVWPSSSLPAPMGSMLVQYSTARLAYQTKAHLLVGGAGGDKIAPQLEGHQPHANSEFLISPSGQIAGEYHKIRLTPFNEYVPLQGKIPWPRWITPLRESFVPGETYTLFQISEARFGAPICGENMHPDLFRSFVRDGANFMVSVTNEAFYGRTSAPYQSLALNVFRAVENRVAVARAATTGISAFIEPTGRIVDRVVDGNGKDIFVSGFLVRNVPLSTSRTFYTLYGDVFASGMFALALVMVLASMVARRSSRPQPVPALASE